MLYFFWGRECVLVSTFSASWLMSVHWRADWAECRGAGVFSSSQCLKVGNPSLAASRSAISDGAHIICYRRGKETPLVAKWTVRHKRCTPCSRPCWRAFIHWQTTSLSGWHLRQKCHTLNCQWSCLMCLIVWSFPPFPHPLCPLNFRQQSHSYWLHFWAASLCLLLSGFTCL